MDSHFINIARNITGRRWLPPIKPTIAVDEGLEEIVPVGPVEYVMLEACKNGEIQKYYHCHFATDFHPKKTIICKKVIQY